MITIDNIKTLSLASLLCLFSCAGDDMVEMTVSEPATLQAYDYLKSYDVLKSYADFETGINVDAGTFLDKGMEYRIAASNFSQLVPGTLFSHANMMKASGAIDTTTAAELLSLAKEKGMTIFATPLISDKNNNSAYLNSKLEPNVTYPEGDEGGYCIKMTNTDAGSAGTDEQVAYTFARTPSVEPGIKYKLTFMVRGTNEGTVQCATYSNNKGSRFTPAFSVTTEWTKVSMTNSMASGITGLSSILFNIGLYVGTLYVDDIELYELDDWNEEAGDNLNSLNSDLDDAEQTAESVSIQTDANGTLEDVGVSLLGEGYDPLAVYTDKTEEEKTAILNAEMEKYIGGVMSFAGGDVDEWSVVNEPLDGTVFRSQNGGALGSGEFYWYDYLGKDYAVTAFNLAKEYGDSNDLFYISESGMESDAENTDALIAYVSYIETQGARVDGIAAIINIDTETADETLIENMFTKLSATGKLVKIVNLTVTINNNEVTDSVTEEQLMAQSDLYRAVTETYLSAVPSAQRGGICQSAVLDAVYPTGLWDSAYSRKHAYGGIIEALKQ